MKLSSINNPNSSTPSPINYSFFHLILSLFQQAISNLGSSLFSHIRALYNLQFIISYIYSNPMQKQLEAIKNGDTNLYDHLIKVLKQMVVNNDKDSYHLFEYYSQKVKSNNLPQSIFRNQQYQQLISYVKKTKGIVDKINTGTEQQPAQPGPTGYLPNLNEQAKWFERCGVGFGQQLTFTIFKSLQKFSITKQIKQLKFWGKIAGTTADYYIAESPAQAGQQELSPDVEPRGTGINKFNYWVSTDLNGQWKDLPTITPTQMVTSRKIKYLFTGNLDKQIFTNPHFPGKQAHLLKCQIVRINYSCSIVPRTMYNVNADDKKQIDPPSEEWKIPAFSFLSQISNWVHYPQNILKNGRMTILKPEIPEGVDIDEQKLMKELQAKDPLQQRLKPISKDKAANLQHAWTVKKYGDCSEYKSMSKNPNDQINYGFLCLRSLIWKGWHTVYHNKQWINIYVGNGFKSTEGWYFPKEPEVIIEEPKDRSQQKQPNFPPEAPKKDGDVPAQQV